MKIVIPTYKRLHKQLTLRSLNAVRDRVWLVVRSEEADEARKIHNQLLVIDQPVSGIADTLKWINTVACRNEKIWMCDDDLMFNQCFIDPQVTYIKKRMIRRDEHHHIFAMCDYIDELSEQYVHGGVAQVSGVPNPRYFPYRPNTRYCTNKWYDNRRIPVDYIDYNSIPLSSDFYVMLQLFDLGYDCATMYNYMATPAPTNAPGGCSTYRTVDLHNFSLEQIQKKFPHLITLRKKIQKSGPWRGLEKYACTIRMQRKVAVKS